MQCPNCRKVEKGRWLYANGHRSSSDFDLDAWVTEDFYDLSYSELPFGFQWCPFRGITQLASLFEEGESQHNSYHESLGNSAYGEQSTASTSTHVCPYLALHGLPHAMHTMPSSSSIDSVQENNTFPRLHNNFEGGQPSADMLNSHNFTSTEPHSHNWQQEQHSFPFSPLGNAADQSASQFGPRISRSAASSQQRLGSFVHPYPLVHGSGPHQVSPLGPPGIGELRGGPTHTRGHTNNHVYHQSIPSPPLQTQFPPMRRSRPRGFALISSLAATSSSSAEINGFYGFTSVSTSANPRHQESESMTRRFNQFYGWGGAREGLTPLPWIPLDSESQWWGPFNPNQAPPQSTGSFLQRANSNERVGQNQADNGYQRMPPPRMPPPSYM